MSELTIRLPITTALRLAATPYRAWSCVIYKRQRLLTQLSCAQGLVAERSAVVLGRRLRPPGFPSHSDSPRAYGVILKCLPLPWRTDTRLRKVQLNHDTVGESISLRFLR